MAERKSRLSRGIAIAKRSGIKKLLSRTTVVVKRRALSRLQERPITRLFYYQLFDSADYWEQRYANGRSSGPGSTGEHARFKSDFVNGFVDEHDVETVLEFGCGDGAQLTLGEYPSYVGLDVSESVIERCREKFDDDPTKRFRTYDPFEFDDHEALRAELVLSMEVVFHLVEDDVFEKTFFDIFTAAERYVIIFSSNHEEQVPEIHMRHRRFTDHVEEAFPAFECVEFVANPFEERVSDFYVFERTAGA